MGTEDIGEVGPFLQFCCELKMALLMKKPIILLILSSLIPSPVLSFLADSPFHLFLTCSHCHLQREVYVLSLVPNMYIVT